MKKKEVYSIFIRYLILILIGLPNLFIFYFVLTPLTTYPTFVILNIFYDVIIFEMTTLIVNSFVISIVPACIAGAAYYLLLILNLTTPMPSETRIKSLLFLFITFLVLNILRITVFSALLVNGHEHFDITHTATWYFGSTILVIAIWFANIKIFKIKKIPIYADIKKIASLKRN